MNEPKLKSDECHILVVITRPLANEDFVDQVRAGTIVKADSVSLANALEQLAASYRKNGLPPIGEQLGPMPNVAGHSVQ